MGCAAPTPHAQLRKQQLGAFVDNWFFRAGGNPSGYSAIVAAA